MSKTEPQLVMIGAIARAHGLQGTVKVRATIDEPEQFFLLQKVRLQRGEDALGEYVIERVQVGNNGVLIKFSGVDDRNDAEFLRGAQLMIAREECLPREADQYFLFEIVGLPVYTETGQPLGDIIRIDRYPANDVWVIRSGQQEKLIPAIDSVIQKVDLSNRRVIIKPMPGLLEN